MSEASMQTTLKKINRIVGVRGSLIVDREGLVVASDMSDRCSPNTLAALGSNVASSLASALSRLQRGSFDRFVVTGTGGSVVLLSIGHGMYLVTLLNKDAMLGLVLVELKDAASALQSVLNLQ